MGQTDRRIGFAECTHFSSAGIITELQRLVDLCESELCSLDMLINAKKSAGMRVGLRYNVACSSIVAGNQNLPLVDKIRYLEIFFIT